MKRKKTPHEDGTAKTGRLSPLLKFAQTHAKPSRRAVVAAVSVPWLQQPQDSDHTSW
jgi:hypothetical protein